MSLSSSSVRNRRHLRINMERKEYPDLTDSKKTDDPLLTAVTDTLSSMHGGQLPAAFKILLKTIFLKQSEGDTCIRLDAANINAFYRELLCSQTVDNTADKDMAQSLSQDTPVPDIISQEEIDNALLECADLIGENTCSDKPLIHELDRLYIRRYCCYENTIAQFIKRATADNADLTTLANGSDDSQKYLDSLKDNLDTLFSQKTATECDMQKIAVAMALLSRFCIITGGPGTGKTTTVAKLLVLLQIIKPSLGKIMLCAPTGKAAGRLTQSIRAQFLKPYKTEDSDEYRRSLYALLRRLTNDENRCREIEKVICNDAVTVDKLLGSIPHRAHKIRNADNTLDCDILVVDEVSMVDLANFAKLCACLKPDTRVILLGDKDQLASVEAGSVLSDLCRKLGSDHKSFDENKLSLLSGITGYDTNILKKQPLLDNTVGLIYSYRFAEYAGIGALAQAVNSSLNVALSTDTDKSCALQDIFSIYSSDLTFNGSVLSKGKSFKALRTALEDLCSISRLNDPTSIVCDYLGFFDYLREHLECGLDEHEAQEAFKLLDNYRILCANREGLLGVDNINELIENTAKSYIRDFSTRRTDEGWFTGKVVLITKNNYILSISNGDVGFVAPVRNKDGSRGDLKVWFMGSRGIFNISPVFLIDYESGYAMTIHKSQGSEYNKVCILLSTRLNKVMTKELIYTGITRAKNHVTIFSDEEVFRSACSRSITRESGLSLRLEQLQ